MILDNNELASAVLFFDPDGEISKEINFAEFEAVLDGYVAMLDYCRRNMQAVFVEINHAFCVRLSTSRASSGVSVRTKLFSNE